MSMKFQDLIGYKKSFDLAMNIFEISKKFPGEEKYSLIDQMRRSSRAVCAAIAESYGKRRYLKHYISKLTDADSENLETQTWLQFASECNYITKIEYNELIIKSEEVGKLLNHMMINPSKYGVIKS